MSALINPSYSTPLPPPPTQFPLLHIHTISSFLHDFLQAVHDVLTTDPRYYAGAEIVCLDLQEPVHGEVPPGKGDVPGPQRQRWTNIIGAVSDVEHPLEGSAALLVVVVGVLLPPRQVLPQDRLLAHVVGTAGARMRVERQQDQAARVVEAGRVGENLLEKVAHAGALQPRLDEVHVGVGHHGQLEVLLVALQVVEQVEEARRGLDLLHRQADGVLGHALLGHIGQHLLHVLVVVALSVAVLQPVGEPLAGQGPHHRVVAALIDDGLVEVEEHQEAPSLLLLGRHLAAVGRGCHLSARRRGVTVVYLYGGGERKRRDFYFRFLRRTLLNCHTSF